MSHRVFHIFTEPHVADPVWVNPVTEHVHSNTVDGQMIRIVRYTDADELLKVAQETRDNLIRQQARQETIDEVLGDLGISRDQWLARLKWLRENAL